MELVELGPLTEEGWDVVLDGEAEPFGPTGAGLEWRPKDRHVGLRDDDGRLVAFAGASVVAVEVGEAGRFDVVGIGSVVVTRSQRGRGLVAQVFEPILQIAEGMGPDRATLFCREQLVALYERWDFALVREPVWAQQRDGPVEMPSRFMWRALRGGAEWPPGRVDVRGLPF